MYKSIIRPLLFALSHSDAERAHEWGLQILKLMGEDPLRELVETFTKARCNQETVCGIVFPNPIGIAAGLDKHCTAIRGLQAIGAGFVEIGTVVPRAQKGNKKPRIFRLTEDQAIINRLGFNSDGMFAVRDRLQAMRPQIRIPVGVNVGKNKDTPNEEAALDYIEGVRVFYPHADYLTANVSSPNTPGLRDLQKRAALEALLKPVSETVREMAAGEQPKPLFVKVSPDVSWPEFDDILDVVSQYAQGIIIGNTTTKRPETLRSPYRTEVGGLSGPMLFGRTLEMTRYANKHASHLPSIAVGGIWTGTHVKLAKDAGASLAQVLAAFIYEGPFLLKRMKQSLMRAP